MPFIRTVFRGVVAAALTSVIALPVAGCSKGDVAPRADAGVAPAPPSTRPLVPIELPAAALEELRATFDDVEELRAMLAKDQLDGTAALGSRASERLTRAGSTSEREDVATVLRQAAANAASLSQAKDIAAARRAFASLSEALFVVAAADPRLQQGFHAFECPMADDFPKWFQRGQSLDNPYMGRRMPRCGSATSWTPPAATEGHAHAESASGDLAYWTCPMHPSVKLAGPGQCPICGMDLTPVTKRELASGVVIVDDVRRQKIGVRTALVRRVPLASEIRAVGRVTYDETGLFDVTLKVSGYVEKLYVEKQGQRITAGQPVMLLQSPELFAAQGELLVSKRAGPDIAAGLVDAAHARFELWGIAAEDVAAIEASGVARQSLPIRAPRGGTVVEKNVVEGARVEAGTRVLRIAALDKVWVEAEVYEADLSRIKIGDTAKVTLPYAGGRAFGGKVAFIYPYLAPETRTGRVRIELANADLQLKPDMFADVVIQKAGEPSLQVDKSAVIFTGERRLVFVDLGEGRLKPVEVKLGRSSSTTYEVLEGLKEGDVVVTSGNFLVAAESRLKSAQSYWSDAPASAAVDGGTP